MTMTQLQSALLSPFKALFGYLLLSLVFLSVLGVFFLSSPSHFIPFPKHSLRTLTPPHGHRDADADSRCELFKGEWVPDPRGSLYNTTSCLTIPDYYKCFKHGRTDAGFLYWRWKPHQCVLPRFDPSAFLELARAKKLAFIGDSVARNHMESLLCLLSQAETPLNVYKDKEGHFQTWNFPSSNFTLIVIWTQFLVKHDERLTNGSTPSGTYDLHIDQVNDAWASKLPDIDYAVISIGHWLFRKNYLYNQTGLIGCLFCDDPGVPTLGAYDALRLILRAALSYIDDCGECGELVTVVRTFSPAHFENGPWNGGGYCNRTGPVAVEEGGGERLEMEMRRVQMEEVERAGRREGRRFVGLDVTGAMAARPDGHPGSNWPGKKWTNGYDDCIHWCMPGPVDAWSELLMATLWREFS